MVRFASCCLIALIAAPLCGCNRPAENPSANATVHTNLQTYEVRGVIVELKPRLSAVRIQHETVPDFMPAMTMDFDVRDTNVLAGLQSGDRVTFQLHVTDTEGWIDNIHTLGSRTNLLPATGNFRIAREVEQLNPGDALPDYRFTNQSGAAFSTADYRGQALAIEFLFTRCPFPTYCPYMAANFESVQQQLLARPNSPTNWQLLTLTFDPEFDTPEILRTYAERHHYNPAHWTFATGSLVDITAIAEQFGLVFWHDESGGITHNLRAAVIGPDGKVRQIFAGNEWKPEELAAALVEAAAARP
ncbi:MAG: SCO family protein [Verrucomicrobiota bacterium]